MDSNKDLEWSNFNWNSSEMKKRYEKLKGAAGIKGINYQLKLLEYFLLQGYQKGDQFRLSTELKIAQNLDDVVYETVEKTILLQAKSSERGISYESLFSREGKGDFNIYSYLKRFPLIEKSLIENVAHIIMCTKSEINLKNINARLNKENKTKKNNYLNEDKEVYLISSIEGKTKCYSFNEEHLHIMNNFICEKNASNSKNTYTLFLKKLVFAFVCDEDLDKQIENLLRAIDKTSTITSIRDNIENWFKDDKAMPLTRTNAEEFFCQKLSEIYINRILHRLSLLADEFVQEFSRGNYPKNLDENLVLFKIDNKETCDLHVLKIYHLLINDLLLGDEIKGDHKKILIVDPHAEFQTKRNIIKVFFIPNYVYLILPLFLEDLEQFSLQGELDTFIKIHQDRKYKKILIISDNLDIETRIKQQNIKKYTVNINLQEISKETQEIILTQKINYQGNKTNLKSIIDKKILSDIVDEITLLQLASGEEVFVNNDFKTYEEIPDYIERKLLIKGHEEISERKFISKACELSEKKVIAIVDSPGMGKSIILNKINYLLRKGPYWTIKLNLNEYSGILYKISKEKRNIITFDEFLYEFSSKSNLETNIFNISNNVILLLDAVDEISPEYTDLVLNTINCLIAEQNIRRIIITTRPHVLDKIDEKNIEYENYSLKQFIDDNVIECLSKFWSKRLNKENDENILNRIQIFAKNLQNELFKKIKWNSIQTLIGIPLQTNMIADIFTVHCKHYLENGENQISLPENLDINWLYDEFIKRKRDIYIEEKCKADGNLATIEALDELFNKAISEHTRQALKLLHPSDQKFLKIIDTPISCEEKTLLKIGIIKKNGSNVQFIHRTYAEYLSAKYICNIILNDNVSDQFLKPKTPTLWHSPFYSPKFCDIFELLLKKRYPVDIRDHSGKTSLHYAAEEGQTDIIKYLLIKGHPVHVIDDYGTTPLHNAARFGSTEIVEILLNKDHPIDVRDDFGQTPLHYAARSRQTGIVKTLLKKGHPIEIRDKHGTTPLHYAVRFGHICIVEILLNEGHQVNIKDDNGKMPLHYAAEEGQKKILQILLTKECPVDIQDNYGTTPLHYAATAGHRDIVEVLLYEGHSVDVKDELGRTPLYYAWEAGQMEVFKILLNKGRLDIRRYDKGRTPLHYAVENGQTDIVEILLNKGHPVEVTDKYGTMPLHYAARVGNIHILEILLKGGHTVAVRNLNGKTPLHYAAEEGHADIVELLLSKGHPVEVVDSHKTTALHYAVRSKQNHVVKILLKKGHPSSVANKYGTTPLHIAASYGSTDVVKILLNNGHPVDIMDNRGKTALHYAAEEGHVEVLKFLLNKGHPIDIKAHNGKTPLHYAVDERHTDIFKILFDAGHSFYIKDKSGSTLLHSAVRYGQTDIVKILLDKKHPLEVGDNYGITPLHVATSFRWAELVEMLIDKGHGVAVTDNTGKTPLHFAAEEGLIDIVKILLNKDHRVDCMDNNHTTPLHYAVQSGKTEIVEILLNKGHPIKVKDKYNTTPLHNAVVCGKPDIVELLLNRGHPVNVKNINGETPLQLATRDKKVTIVKLLKAKKKWKWY